MGGAERKSRRQHRAVFRRLLLSSHKSTRIFKASPPYNEKQQQFLASYSPNAVGSRLASATKALSTPRCAGVPVSDPSQTVTTSMDARPCPALITPLLQNAPGGAPHRPGVLAATIGLFCILHLCVLPVEELRK